jgi:hypothetical protein
VITSDTGFTITQLFKGEKIVRQSREVVIDDRSCVRVICIMIYQVPAVSHVDTV